MSQSATTQTAGPVRSLFNNRERYGLVAPALAAFALLGFFMCLSGQSPVDVGTIIVGTLAARLAVDCVVGSVTPALRHGRVAPFCNGRQTALMALSLPVFMSSTGRSGW